MRSAHRRGVLEFQGLGRLFHLGGEFALHRADLQRGTPLPGDQPA